jgi:tetratricopeptide (TPR) repeat protein
MFHIARLVFFAQGPATAALAFVCLLSSAGQNYPIPQDIQTLLATHRYVEAEQALQRELLRAPDWDVGHLLLAQIYNATGRYEAAERAALAALRRRESVDSFLALAIATMHLGRLNESIGWLEKAANRQPYNPEIYKVLGLDYAFGGNLVECEKAFRRAAQLMPQNWEFHYLDGRALYELRLYPESAKVLRRAVELNPQSTRAWTALGQTQELLYNPAAAEASYRKALELCGAQTRECAWPLMQLGFLATRRKGMREAEQYLRRAIQARPDWAKPHFYLGKTLASLGDPSGAVAELEAAVRLDDSKSEYHYQLAQFYRRLGETGKAAQHLARYEALADRERKRKTPADFGAP